MALAAWLLLSLAQSAPAEVGRWVEEGWALLPEYRGAHRPFLTSAELPRARAALHLFQAATQLGPDHVRAQQSLGHARVLLAEDRRNRGLEAEGREHFEGGVDALLRAIELDGDDPWPHYALGVLRTTFGDHATALADLGRARERAQLRMADSGPDGPDAWLRFKALEWQPEVHMRLGQHAAARDAMRAFHGEFSDNGWPLGIALAESWLRQREFSQARDSLEDLARRFPDDHQAYALLGYLEGLVDRRDVALERLREAIARELDPGLYPRLWLWILAPEAERDGPEADLRQYLEFPPATLSEWDRTLGRFLLGEGTVEGFLERTEAEARRRMGAAEALDGLGCESWFYAGLRRDLAARRAPAGPGRETLQAAALQAYAKALEASPAAWKWEWAYARRNFADLARSLGRGPVDSFSLDGERWSAEGRSAVVESALWHLPGAESPVSEPGRSPDPGDLFLGRARDASGRVAWLAWVVR